MALPGIDQAIKLARQLDMQLVSITVNLETWKTLEQGFWTSYYATHPHEDPADTPEHEKTALSGMKYKGVPVHVNSNLDQDCVMLVWRRKCLELSPLSGLEIDHFSLSLAKLQEPEKSS